MKALINSKSLMTGNGDFAEDIMPIWSEEDIEELQEEMPWEIFSSEIDNWAAINVQAVEL